MPRIYDWAAREAERTVTVADLRASRKSGKRYTQVTAETAEEAAAAEQAGIEMLVTRARNVEAVRRGSKHLFVTAALGFADAVTQDDILRTALKALSDGADAVITARGMATVSMLAAEDIPVVGHLGLVPRKSTWLGRLRAFGKYAEEALALFQRFRRLEEAGAFAVECEVIPARVMSEIRRRIGLVTVSLGSGPDADVIFLFTEDICGGEGRRPRHARVYGDLQALQERIKQERVKALSAFRADVTANGFPGPQEISDIADDEYAAFVSRLKDSGFGD
ncbi:ketopantoate hydroxymethyltransferase (plasmid) [Bradyrhizobium sp. CCBAU 53351]|nr:ketopantoate hydroxymethyltransferase [Bradyrhizobium guangdongense]QAU51206.1 ketopantoate hydroxymethyltransferase [Bradyrhizobium guangzhouense]QOZ49906.1 ketopantoate hydroxymethyltransferase [Bradyrhizobium sp. CCBAU 53340]QOZ56916.1 ketopantoate hydroxymethyltransferase [Bradyrhizobium sp. CCBAU 53338]QOZ80870.1 ketopantoate hydroxymethyltransferase [Bradyrhizobium sp. CCBAU 53351]